MAKNRKAAEKFILEWIGKLSNEDNVNLYKDLFKRMSDKEFDEFMKQLSTGEKILQVILPHDKSKNNLTLDKVYELAKNLGVDLFKHIYIGPTEDMPRVKSKHKYLVYLLPFRRTKQILEKGVSVTLNDKRINLATGQVTDEGRSSKLSYPELQLLIGMGMRDSVIELIKYRGGDLGAYRALKASLVKFGKSSKNIVELYQEGVVSSKTLEAYFAGMHFKINIVSD